MFDVNCAFLDSMAQEVQFLLTDGGVDQLQCLQSRQLLAQVRSHGLLRRGQNQLQALFRLGICQAHFCLHFQVDLLDNGQGGGFLDALDQFIEAGMRHQISQVLAPRIDQQAHR